MELNVLGFVGNAENALQAARIDLAAEQTDAFVAAAGAGVVRADGHEFFHSAAGFLARFPPHDLLRRLAGLDHAGNDLEQPRPTRIFYRTDPELLEQHDVVELGVVEQHAGGVASPEHLPLDVSAHAAAEEAMPQAVLLDLEEPLIRNLSIDDLDVHARAPSPSASDAKR